MFYNPYVHDIVLGLYPFLIHKSNICQGMAFLKHTWRKLKTPKEIKEKRKARELKEKKTQHISFLQKEKKLVTKKKHFH